MSRRRGKTTVDDEEQDAIDRVYRELPDMDDEITPGVPGGDTPGLTPLEEQLAAIDDEGGWSMVNPHHLLDLDTALPSPRPLSTPYTGTGGAIRLPSREMLVGRIPQENGDGPIDAKTTEAAIADFYGTRRKVVRPTKSPTPKPHGDA